ncbi:MAG: hypothetical protein WC082_13740 [Victivallales bacterium]
MHFDTQSGKRPKQFAVFQVAYKTGPRICSRTRQAFEAVTEPEREQLVALAQTADIVKIRTALKILEK